MEDAPSRDDPAPLRQRPRGIDSSSAVLFGSQTEEHDPLPRNARGRAARLEATARGGSSQGRASDSSPEGGQPVKVIAAAACRDPVPARRNGSGTYLTLRRGFGSVAAAGSTAGVGEGAVFAGGVVAGRMRADEFGAGAALHGTSTVCANGSSQAASDETGSVCAAS